MNNGFEPRIRRRTTRLDQSVVMCTLGERENEMERGNILLKQQYFEMIDRVCREIRFRFQENNEILMAVSEASRMHCVDFDRNSLLPLNEIGLIVPSEAELLVIKNYLKKELNKPEWQGSSMMKILYPVKDAFSQTYHLLQGVEVFGSSTSTNESSFSALSRIDTIRRMSMTDQRMCNLAFLAFEKKKLSSLQED